MTPHSAAERGPGTAAGRAWHTEEHGDPCKYRNSDLGCYMLAGIMGVEAELLTDRDAVADRAVNRADEAYRDGWERGEAEAGATAAVPLDHGDHVPAWKWCYFGLTIGKAEAQGVPGHRFCEGCARLSADEEGGTP